MAHLVMSTSFQNITFQAGYVHMLKLLTVDFNSLWPRGFGNILETWELRSRIRSFIVIDGNQIANFETKTMSLICAVPISHPIPL